MSNELENNPLLELFRAEAESQTAVLSEGLLVLERGESSPATIESLMRAAHSLKGAARIVGLDAAVRVAHVLEDYFVAVQRDRVKQSPDHIDVLLRGVDLLSQIAQWLDRGPGEGLAENEPAIAAYVEEVKAIVAGKPSSPPIDLLKPAEPVAMAPAVSSIFPSPPDGGSTVTPSPTPDSAALHPRLTSAAPSGGSGTDGETNAALEAPQPPPPPVVLEKTRESSSPAPEKIDRVVRVNADSLTRLMGLAGESLVEARQFTPLIAALRQLKQGQSNLSDKLRTLEEGGLTAGRPTDEFSRDLLSQVRGQVGRCQQILNRQLDELEDFAHRSEDLSGRLHHEVILSRMRPLADGIRGFPRLVRDLARQLGKAVEFEVRGESTGVDRDVLDKLEAPLNHLIRNAVDHGIETAEARAVAGKSATGRICLEAHHRSGMLQITLSDDGRGIDPVSLRSKIVARGLASAAMAEQLSEAELFEFLFLPGFTTKESVSEISGRGVGLDVVQSMMRSLGGNVRLSSTPGRGTTFTLRLPISMSVIRALLVEVAGEPYAFPLTRIDRIDVLQFEQIQWLEGRPYFTFDGETIGLVEAAQVLDLPEEKVDPRAGRPTVVISDRGHRFGLMVNRILGERDLDVRPLDPRLGKVPNLGGASLLEDGGPVLIFDVEDLVRSIDNLLTGRRFKRTAADCQAALRRTVPRILVVDDSLTVRELERQLLANQGYEVDTAVDGMDGWNAVRGGDYQLVVSDVDMPRMDGIELVRRIKQDARLKAIPVVVVSYKDRAEDRLRGLDAGANCYLTKSSFHDRTFLEAVVDLIGKAR